MRQKHAANTPSTEEGGIQTHTSALPPQLEGGVSSIQALPPRLEGGIENIQELPPHLEGGVENIQEERAVGVPVNGGVKPYEGPTSPVNTSATHRSCLKSFSTNLRSPSKRVQFQLPEHQDQRQSQREQVLRKELALDSIGAFGREISLHKFFTRNCEMSPPTHDENEPAWWREEQDVNEALWSVQLGDVCAV